MILPLVGGGEHDWNIILSDLGALRSARTIADIVRFLAWTTMILAVLWFVKRGRESRAETPLTPSGRQILQEKSISHIFEMGPADAVPPVRIFHEAELLVQFDQPVEHPLRALEMDVVVARAVDEQQFSLESLGEVDRRSVACIPRHCRAAGPYSVPDKWNCRGSGPAPARPATPTLYNSGERNIRLRVIEPPPLQP